VKILDRLEHHWYESEIERNFHDPKAASHEEVILFEQENGVTLPADFREYFLRLNDIDEDPGLFCFWPLSRLKRLDGKTSASLQSEGYFYFADYLIESHYYAIYLGNDPFFQNRVILPDFPNKPVIANTFSEFLELYMLDSPTLYGNS
jgi:hypothetical protein